MILTHCYSVDKQCYLKIALRAEIFSEYFSDTLQVSMFHEPQI